MGRRQSQRKSQQLPSQENNTEKVSVMENLNVVLFISVFTGNLYQNYNSSFGQNQGQ